MTTNTAVVAIFADHQQAEAAIRKLSDGGLDMKHFSIVGKGSHTEQQVVGFYNAGDRITLWGKTGAIWGGIWGLFFGGMLFMVPVVGPVIVLGHLAAMVIGAVEGAVIFGGLGVLGGALVGLGIPEDSVIRYEEALKDNGFLVVAHGPVEEMEQARTILETMNPSRLDQFDNVKEMPVMPANQPAHVM